jgi:hypothetical protein
LPEGLDVGEAQQRVGRRFEVQQARGRPPGLGDGVEVARVDEAELDPELGIDRLEQAIGAAIEVVAGDDVIALLAADWRRS